MDKRGARRVVSLGLAGAIPTAEQAAYDFDLAFEEALAVLYPITDKTGEQMPKAKAEPRPTVPQAPEGGPENDGRPPENTEAPGPGAGPPPGTEGQGRALPTLPTEKTVAAGTLEEKTVLLYGPAGIGKSTLASQWGGGSFFFFDCAGELGDLEVYRGAVTGWTSFREWGAAYVTGQASGQFGGCVIDTADALGMMASDSIRSKHGILHESDLEWGKGWDQLKRTFITALAKLQVTKGGVVLVSHSKEIEIKTRSEVYNRQVPTLTGGVREACVNTADLVLLLDWDDNGDNRVIHTKPGKYHEAKERGQQPRLPAEIVWPTGTNGWDVLKAAWDSTNDTEGDQA